MPSEILSGMKLAFQSELPPWLTWLKTDPNLGEGIADFSSLSIYH